MVAATIRLGLSLSSVFGFGFRYRQDIAGYIKMRRGMKSLIKPCFLILLKIV